MPPRPSTTLFPYTTLFRSVSRASARPRDNGPPWTNSGARFVGFPVVAERRRAAFDRRRDGERPISAPYAAHHAVGRHVDVQDRKSTRLNSSHSSISYAVFC